MNEIRTELAALKREHEALREAAERAEEHLRVCGEWPVQSQIIGVADDLRAALDTTPAEPVRDRTHGFWCSCDRCRSR